MLFWGWGAKNKHWNLGNGYALMCHYEYFHLMFILRFTFNKKWFILGDHRSQDIQLSKEQLNQLFQGQVPKVNEYYTDDINPNDIGFNDKAYKMLSTGNVAIPVDTLPKRKRRFNKKLLFVLSIVVAIIVIATIVGAVTPSDTSQHISNDTGLSKEQANTIEQDAQKNLASFSEVGDSYIKDGQQIVNAANGIDCINYSYQFENAGISCSTGKSQQQTMGNDEITLGNCYKNLTQDSSYTVQNINQCISDIDAISADYNLPVVNYMYDDATSITDFKNGLIYNKATLQSATDDLNNSSD